MRIAEKIAELRVEADKVVAKMVERVTKAVTESYPTNEQNLLMKKLTYTRLWSYAIKQLEQRVSRKALDDETTMETAFLEMWKSEMNRSLENQWRANAEHKTMNAQIEVRVGQTIMALLDMYGG